MATQTELIYLIFHLIRLVFSVLIFVCALLFVCGGCAHERLRGSKRQWLMFNFCVAAMIFAIINAVFAGLPFAPMYVPVIITQVCMLQHFLEDVAQGQVAYALVAMAIHHIGPEEWKNRSLVWCGFCISIHWLCSFLLPLPQILMSNIYVCFGYLPNQFFTIYSIAFLLTLPVCLHLFAYLASYVLKTDGPSTTQVYPGGQTDPTGISHRSSANYVFIMGLLLAIVGYAPRALLAVVDVRLQQSIALYAILEILPSMSLLVDCVLLLKMNKETRKKITSVCGC